MRKEQASRWRLGGAALMLVVLSMGAALGAPRVQGKAPPRARLVEARNDKSLAQGKDYVKKMQESVRRVQRKRDDAKAQKDLIKLNCLNDKLSQAAAQLRDGEQSLGALGEAMAGTDSAARTFELSRIRIYSQKVQALMADADGCSGEDANYVGPNRTDVEVDPTIPKGDPTDPGLPSATSTLAPPGIEEAATDSPSSNLQSPSP